VTQRLSAPQLALWAGLGIIVLLLGVRVAGASDHEAQPTNEEPLRVRSAGADSGSSGAKLVVHVAGEVQRPGVYSMPVGSRVADALEQADGPTSEAAADAINLAARLSDGQQVVVPARARQGSASSAAVPGAVEAPISLGSATQADLETLDGIGPVTAADMIEFRDQNGGIAAIEDLDQIPGIGPATVEALRDSLQP